MSRFVLQYKNMKSQLLSIIFFLIGILIGQTLSANVNLGNNVVVSADSKNQQIIIQASRKKLPHIKDSVGATALAYLVTGSPPSASVKGPNGQAAIRAALRMILNQPLVLRNQDLSAKITAELAKNEIDLNQIKSISSRALSVLKDSKITHQYGEGVNSSEIINLSALPAIAATTSVSGIRTISSAFANDIKADFNSLACPSCATGARPTPCPIDIVDLRSN